MSEDIRDTSTVGGWGQPPQEEIFNEDYYMRGPETGVSNYRDCRWLPETTLPCVQRMMRWLGAQNGDSVHDFGCGRGFYVKALRILGYDARGHDISRWAVANCDPEVGGIVSNDLISRSVDWVICKDVLEHTQGEAQQAAVGWILRHATKGALIIVPLAEESTVLYTKRRFVAPQHNADKTHVTCWTMREWLHYIQGEIGSFPFAVSAGYRLKGVKQACDEYPDSVAFITIRSLVA